MHPQFPIRRGAKRIPLLTISSLVFAWMGVGLGFAEKGGNQGTGERRSFQHQGIERAYRIYVPSGYNGKTPVPLLFCFHGGGGNAEVGSAMGFTPLAEQEGFIVVYPEGLNKHWNDGRRSGKFLKQDAEIDDVAFVRALLGALGKQYRIDERQIFTTGPSNGGFFSQRLAIEASDVFAAAAILIATLPKPFEENFHPVQPISILFINGTQDPFVPYGGGPITPEFFPLRRKLQPNKDYQRGQCSSTDKSVALWRAHNGTNPEPVVRKLPDKDPADGCTVETFTWSGGRKGTSVVLYRVEGGGHTIPGGAAYLPERIIGKVCRDFDGVGTVWEFFKHHARPVSGTGKK